MSTAIIAPATSFITTILSYFNPSKSPFYSVVAFGTLSLILTCEDIENISWLTVAIPVFLVLMLSTYLSFRDMPVFQKGQGEEQLRFARSFCICSALLTFVLTARYNNKHVIAFWVNYSFCTLQIITFLLYTWARSRSYEPHDKTNFVQIALITATLLVGASWANSQYAIKSEQATNLAGRYQLVAIALYLTWIFCIVYWLKHLKGLIHVEIPSTSSEIPCVGESFKTE